jgi:7-keto-8-aminopelargonate synthetase-like enzyme
LSKAFGVYGGAVLGRVEVIEAIQERSRLFLGNTPPPLPLVNAALRSLKILQTDRSLRDRLVKNTTRIKTTLRTGGVSLADNASPIVAVVPRNARHASRLSRALLRGGIFPPLIRYGGSEARFRFAISSEHTARQLDTLAETLARNP